MNERLLPRWAALSLEAALLTLLSASWVGGWVATRSNLNALPPGTRRVTLGFWSTSSQLWFVPLIVAATVGLLVARHARPQISFWSGIVVLIVYAWFYPMVDVAEFGSTLALLVLAGWAILRGTHVVPVALAALVTAGAATVRFYGVQQNLVDSGQTQSPVLTSLSETMGRVIVVAMAISVAWLVRRMRLQADELADRNVELVQRRGEAAKAAVVDERLRISRELHDVVAHHITTMTVHAGGASRALASNVEAAESSLQQIAASGRDAIGDLQRMLGFLRGQEEVDAESRSPAPSLRHLDRLVNTFGDDLEITATVTGPVDSIPASVDLSAYRIVQEALTNVVKHSDAGAAQVLVAVGADATEVEVVNAGTVSDVVSEGTGHGIIGMQERVALHQGTMDVGPYQGEGWRVRAVLSHGAGERT